MSTNGSTGVQTQVPSETLRVLGTTGAEPAFGPRNEESPSELRLLSVSYTGSVYAEPQGSVTIRGEAHVGPDDDAEAIFQKLRQWVHAHLPIDQADVDRMEQETLDLREQVRKQREALERLKSRVKDFQTFLDRWEIPYPIGFYGELQDLPF